VLHSSLLLLSRSCDAMRSERIKEGLLLRVEEENRYKKLNADQGVIQTGAVWSREPSRYRSCQRRRG
jgi:hypothetical protein